MTMPAPVVQFYFDSLAAWTNVSGYVLMTEGLSMRRGRSNQFETSSPGSMSLTLDNSSGIFTPGNAGGYGTDIRKNCPVRVAHADTTVIWTGFVDSWTVPLGAGAQAVVKVTATDKFKHYAQSRLAAYGIEKAHSAIGAYSAGATYPLTAPANGVGSFWTAHRDAAADPIRIYGGTAGEHEFTQDGPPFVGSAFKIKPWANVGPCLEHPTTFNPGADYCVVQFWFRTEAQEDAWLFRMSRTSGGTGTVNVYLDGTTGSIIASVTGDSSGSLTDTSTRTNLYDGLWHHVLIQYTPASGTTQVMYVDGGSADTATSGGTACTIGSGNRRAVFGGLRNSGWTDNSYSLDGDLACVGLYIYTATPVLTTAYGAGMDGDTGDTISTRVTNGLTDFCNFANPAYANTSSMTLAGQDTNGKSYLEAVQEIAETERGVFYIDRSGDPKFRGQDARSSAASVTLNLDATQDLTGDFQLVLDDALFANTVVASGPAGSYTAQDATSFGAIGPVVDSFTCLASSEALLGTAADARLADRISEDPRLSRITIDLLTTPNSIESTVIQLVPLDRVHITNLPSTVLGTAYLDGFVEGWQLDITDSSYTCALDLSPCDVTDTYPATYTATY